MEGKLKEILFNRMKAEAAELEEANEKGVDKNQLNYHFGRELSLWSVIDEAGLKKEYTEWARNFEHKAGVDSATKDMSKKCEEVHAKSAEAHQESQRAKKLALTALVFSIISGAVLIAIEIIAPH